MTVQLDQHTETPAARIEHAYRTWSKTKGKSPELFIDLMGDGIEMRSVLDPDIPDELAADRKSLAEARDYFAIIDRDWEMIDYPTERVVADGDTVVWIGRCHWRHRTSGNEVNCPKVDIWHFENGKAVSFLEMFDSLAFVRAVGVI